MNIKKSLLIKKKKFIFYLFIAWISTWESVRKDCSFIIIIGQESTILPCVLEGSEDWNISKH